jgi:hypothetical protein
MSYCVKISFVEHEGNSHQDPVGEVMPEKRAAELEGVPLETFAADKSSYGWVNVNVGTELSVLGWDQYRGMNGTSPYYSPTKQEDGSWSALMHPNNYV